MTSISVGDRVRLKVDDNHGSYEKGDVVTITGFDDEGFGIHFMDKTGVERWLPPRHVEPLPKIKVGDRIRLTADNGGFGRKGAEGTITWIGDFRGGRDWAVDFDRLELIAKPAFKVGDRVRIKRGATPIYRGLIGKTGKISVTRDHSFDVYVDEYEAERFGFLPDELELLDDEPQPADRQYIVARLDDDGQPLPSHRPFVHPDRAAATTEAERLAIMAPGVGFAVFERVSTSRAEVPVAKTEAA